MTVTTDRECTCPPREFAPTDDGRCYRCNGIPPQRCPTCNWRLSDQEIVGAICLSCGSSILKKGGK